MDHPRSRGENDSGYQPEQVAEGSSPLTRGKPDGREAGSARGGIIPAHAGKTCGREVLNPPHWDHPRSRGENRFKPHG